MGIPDYASTMAFELFTDVAPANPFPKTEDIKVRFLFHNGTTGSTSAPTRYPLFGQTALALSWNDFASGMNKFAIGDQGSWCAACGNRTGVCAPVDSSSSPSSPSSPNGKSEGGGDGGSGGLSRPVAGVIGAVVTLAVVLGIEGLVLLVMGLRVVGKKGMNGHGAATANGNGKA